MRREAEAEKSVLVSRNLRLRRREKQKPTTVEMFAVGGVGAAKELLQSYLDRDAVVQS